MKSSDLALDLLHAEQRHHRDSKRSPDAPRGRPSATLFGRETRLPAGFALAGRARDPSGLRRPARASALSPRQLEPLEVEASRNREAAFATAMAKWTRQLEEVIRASWYQWFMFEEMA